jgi:methyltransferase (TIGR00027 family)
MTHFGTGMVKGSPMPNNSGQTAFPVATMRAFEQYQPEDRRLFDDPVVAALLNAPSRLMIRSTIIRKALLLMYNGVAAGVYGLQICRTRYIDEILKTAMTDGIGQVVILGAGLDTRPYRIPGIDRLNIIEVDLPNIQRIKKHKIQQFLGSLPSHVRYVSMDFNVQSLEDVLPMDGLDLAKPVLFIWEGVTQYLSRDAINHVFDFISKTASGSRVVFTYVPQKVINKTSTVAGVNTLTLFMEANDSPWVFGIDPSRTAEFIKPFHLELIEDVGSSYFQSNYLKPVRRNLFVSGTERIAYARVS